MKLRLRTNSIRLRLTRPEVEAIGRAQALEETIHFPDGASLAYRLECTPGGPEISARLEGRALIVSLGEEAARRWSAATTVGLERTVPLPGGGHLDIFIEKDFECLHPGHGQSVEGAYPNPTRAPREEG